jgi:crotonobetainyl-CoA:carnitine CoA-transferase CaiB-like acyl-CoA transferase
MSAHASIVPFQFFATTDGHVAIACAKEKFFQDLIRLLGLEEAMTDPRFATFAGRREHRVELLAVLSRRFATDTTAHWIELLHGSVPVAPVRTAEEALAKDELLSLEMLASYHSPVFGDVSSIASPIGIDGYAPDYRAAPALGADTMAVLYQAGLSTSAIEELKASGAFGTDPTEVDVEAS